jgi:carboxypeptidase PM20D1
MKSWKWIGLAVATGLLILISLMGFRAVNVLSLQPAGGPQPAFPVDTALACQHLSAAVRIPTINTGEGPHSPESRELVRFHQFLKETFPLVHHFLKWEAIGGKSLLYEWPGRIPDRTPLLFAAHMDVVPIDPKSEGQWKFPPFAGTIAEGFIWGRGTLDDKHCLLALLEAAELLLKKGFQPAQTIYFAFGHDEESGGGYGARQIAETLKTRGARLEAVIDEGMVIMEGGIPGIKNPVALVGIAEKGYVSFDLTVHVPGGHSSNPAFENAIGILAKAIARIGDNPFPAEISAPVRLMLDYLTPEALFPQKLVFTNLWLFEPILKRMLLRRPETAALLRTTSVVTMFQAGVKENVIPEQASAGANLRLAPGDSVKAAQERLSRIIGDSRVQILPREESKMEPSKVSSPGSRIFRSLAARLAPFSRELWWHRPFLSPLQIPATMDLSPKAFSDLSQWL